VTILTQLVLLLAAATPSVEYDPNVDFSRYDTWSWHEGVTPSMNPVTDKRIREAIESGLAARGLAHVDGKGTLLVVYHASRSTQIDTSTLTYASPPTKTAIRYVQKASLLVDMLDAASGKVVWRGYATGVLRYGPNEIAEQVKAAIDEMLAGFPPKATRPSP
jgi:Domain of unknown function (DUF4136)